MKFDLTPLIKSSYRQFLLAPLLAGTGVAALAGMFFGAEVALGLSGELCLGALMVASCFSGCASPCLMSGNRKRASVRCAATALSVSS